MRLPMTPQQALKEYGQRMTAYERREIMEFPEVWYLGLEAKKIDGVPGGQQNCGYDDENGSYIKMIHDHISYRYEIREIIGKGSFGQVVKVTLVVCMCVCVCVCVCLLVSQSKQVTTMCVFSDLHVCVYIQAFDHKTNQLVALKIIRNKKRFHHQALVEVKILDSLRKRVSCSPCAHRTTLTCTCTCSQRFPQIDGKCV